MLGQFKSLDRSRARHMGAAAKIDPIALPIERNGFSSDAFDDLDLIVLAHLAKQLDRFLARQFFARHFQIGLGQFLHALFDQFADLPARMAGRA